MKSSLHVFSEGLCRVFHLGLMPIVFILVVLPCALSAQQEVQHTIVDLNQQIDNAVVKKDFNLLRQLYADDFVFTHGTGVVDNKESWLKDIEQSTARFISRQHDSTTVEVHDNVAIISGRLMVTRQHDKGTSQYGIRYVRVYAWRKKQWLLISHRTVKEWHY